MKRILIYILLLCSAQKLLAQDREVQGIVFDANSKQRLSRVYIYNTSKHKGFYNNSKGEFSTMAATGDVLVAAVPGYGIDTMTVRSASTIIFYLKRNSILLKEVTIRDSVLSPQQRLERNREEYAEAYRKGDTKDMLQIGGANGTGGVGLGIDALWSLLSREGKNARNLQKIIEQDYRDKIINYRYSPRLVANVTGLKPDSLRDFMEQYRPTYNMVLEANDYTLIEFIKASFFRYQQHPEARRLPPLVPATGQ